MTRTQQKAFYKIVVVILKNVILFGVLMAVITAAVYGVQLIVRKKNRWLISSSGTTLGAIVSAIFDKRFYEGIGAVIGAFIFLSIFGKSLLEWIIDILKVLTGGTQNFRKNFEDNQENQRKPKKEIKRRHLVEKAYKLLGVNSEATMDEIQSSYRRLLARKHHPDKGGSYANWHKLMDKAMANIKKERNIST
jgi:hypothetical protein